MDLRRPAPRPCDSCPMRLDVPSGVWAAQEYQHLAAYDPGAQTGDQPASVFCCHNDPERICAGWASVCADEHNLGLRVAAALGWLDEQELAATLGYVSPVPLFAHPAQAARHGLAEVENPSPAAVAAIARIKRKRGLT